MEYTVELRYESGSSTVLSIDAESADAALAEARDARRLLVGIHITAPELRGEDAPMEASRRTAFPSRRIPVQHRPSRRQR